MTDKADETSEVVEAIKEGLKTNVAGRFSSPFLGAFLVSWIAWNHRLLFVLFSDLKIDARFHYIDESLYPSAVDFLTYNIGGPLLSALAYIFLLPWPTEWVHRWNLERRLRLKYAELKSDGNRLLTQDESDELRARITELKASLDSSRMDLHNSRRKSAALSLKTLEKFGGDDERRVTERYLTSQAFLSEEHSGRMSSKWHFHSGGELETKAIKGDLRWHFQDGKILVFDAQKSQRLGHFKFDRERYRFDGEISGFGYLSLKGNYYSMDFSI